MIQHTENELTTELVTNISSMALPETSVAFTCADKELEKLVARAEAMAAANVVQFTPSMTAMVCGGGYSGIYLEGAPCGEMYANRNLRAALNSVLFFLMTQRGDGRLPGVIFSVARKILGNGMLELGADGRRSGAVVPVAEATLQDWLDSPFTMYVSPDWVSQGLLVDFGQLSGNFLPHAAYEMYFRAGKPDGYLKLVADCLEQFDAYLWRTRDPDNEGILQSWCVHDTGEDGCIRFGGGPDRWPHDYPPTGEHTPNAADPRDRQRYTFSRRQAKEKVILPFRSMDMMAYSFDNRMTRALISDELQDGKSDYWRERAEEVRHALTKHLWRPEKSAAFDRDRDNKFMDTLIHNNLRCMHFGVFSQDMADEFIKRHLLNPTEFWTPVPFPSIAANDPIFRNIPGNDWNGQAHCLTFQRAIRAFENYGHYAELTLLGRKMLQTIKNAGMFTIQFDPFDIENPIQGNKQQDGNSVMTLSFLEYVARFFGIHIERGRIFWSGLTDSGKSEYIQNIGDKSLALRNDGETFAGTINGKEIFSCAAGVRVVTDMDGDIAEIVGIDTETRRITLRSGIGHWEITVAPNEVYGLSGGEPKLLRAVPYFKPLPFTGKCPAPVPATDFFMRWKTTPVLPGEGIAEMSRSTDPGCPTTERAFAFDFVNMHPEWQGKTGHAVFFGHVDSAEAMDVEIRLGYDGPIRLWIGKKEIHRDLAGINPAERDEFRFPAKLPAGRSPVTIMMALNEGKACGFFLRMARPHAERSSVLPNPWKE